MKVGIATFCFAQNSGAVLQAYALRTTVQKLLDSSDTVEVINYCYRDRTERQACVIWRPPISLNPRKLAKFLYKRAVYMKINQMMKLQDEHFQEFRDFYLQIGSTKITEQNIKDSGFDCILIGSDQVWNPTSTNNRLDPMYFAVYNEAFPKIMTASYAASAGSNKQFEGKETQVLARMKNFHKISVRERNLREFLEENKIESQLVLDPVFLLETNEYNRISEKRVVEEKYLFLYQMGESKEIMRIAQKLSKERGLILIDWNDVKRSKDINYRNYASGGPLEFISCIRYADYVVCNSFHTIAFSIMFHKEFVVVPHGTRNERLSNLLKTFGLEERFAARDGLVSEKSTCYTVYEEKIAELRQSSIDYLKHFIKLSQHGVNK